MVTSPVPLKILDLDEKSQTNKQKTVECITTSSSLKGRGRPRFFTTRKNRRGLISITGSVTDKNCSEQSQPEMSITRIRFKIQCTFRTLFPNYSQDIFSKTTKAGHIIYKQVSCSHANN